MYMGLVDPQNKLLQGLTSWHLGSPPEGGERQVPRGQEMPQFIEGSARKCWIHGHPGVDMEVSKNHLKGEC